MSNIDKQNKQLHDFLMEYIRSDKRTAESDADMRRLFKEACENHPWGDEAIDATLDIIFDQFVTKGI